MGRWLAALAGCSGANTQEPAKARTDETDKTGPKRVSSVLSVPGLSVFENSLGPDNLEAPKKSETDFIEGGVVIDLADHFARAQRIADQKNADAAQRHHTDRWCACGDYSPFAWRIGGREVWLCERCRKGRRHD